MSIQGNDGFLDLENASLRVTGNVHAEGLKVGSVRLQSAATLQSTTVSGNTTTQMVQFTNPTKGFDVTSNIEVGDANLYVDTTTGRVGVGTNAPMGTLDVKGVLNHTQVANVAQITSNSNVVMEYRRSKKLIKYPRVYLTSTSQDGYVASATAESDDGTYNSYEAFDGDLRDISAWQPNYPTGGDFGTDGIATTQTQFNPGGGAALVNGPALIIQFPHKVRVTSYNVYARKASDTSYQFANKPKSGKIYGSNDGSTWTHVDTFGDWTSWTNNVPQTETVTTPGTYNRYALVVETITYQSQTWVAVGEWELYGLPEYDPEAHGTDVTVKSVPNVPNTDWLEVYYDAKDLADGSTTVNDLKPTGTANNGTVAGNTSVTDGAFTFDGNGDYIETTLGSHISGDWTNTVSFWIAWNAIPTSGTQTPFMVGQPDTSTNGIGVDFNANGSMIYFTTSGDIVTINNVFDLITPGKWIHFTFIHTPSKKYVYWDGKQVGIWTSGGAATLPTSPTLSIGRRGSSSTNYINAKIANFRLFNRALISDEIYQLYAYQKEYFGHGDLSMSLKAGRLGIGTSEPRAVLDVRGDIIGRGIKFNNKVVVFSTNSTNNSTTMTEAARVYYTPIYCSGSQFQVVCEVTYGWSTAGSADDQFTVQLLDENDAALDVVYPRYLSGRMINLPKDLIGVITTSSSSLLTFKLVHRRWSADDANTVYVPRFKIYQILI